MSIPPLYEVRGSFTLGELEGGKARLELDQMSRKALPCKACVERSDYFRAEGCTKITTLFQAVEKPKAFSTA